MHNEETVKKEKYPIQHSVLDVIPNPVQEMGMISKQREGSKLMWTQPKKLISEYIKK